MSLPLSAQDDPSSAPHLQTPLMQPLEAILAEGTISKVLRRGKATICIAVSYDAAADVYRVCANQEFALAASALKRVEQLVAGLKGDGWTAAAD